MGVSVLAYLARPWSCWWALSRFTPEDPVPYSRFDYHGFGVMSAWVTALLFAPPMLWLASKIFLSGAAKFRMFGRAGDGKSTILSIAIALGLGAPMHAQLSYLMGLPIGITTPVWVSSLIWLVMVEVGRTAAVENNLLGRGDIGVAGAVALLASVPKLALLGFAALN